MITIKIGNHYEGVLGDQLWKQLSEQLCGTLQDQLWHHLGGTLEADLLVNLRVHIEEGFE